jgi:hypothetical protein
MKEREIEREIESGSEVKHTRKMLKTLVSFAFFFSCGIECNKKEEK